LIFVLYQRPFVLTHIGRVNGRWDESFLARRRPPTRRAIPGALIAGRVVDEGSWYYPLRGLILHWLTLRSNFLEVAQASYEGRMSYDHRSWADYEPV
jgi:hypothetical protein